MCLTRNYLYKDLVVEYLFGKGREKDKKADPPELDCYQHQKKDHSNRGQGSH